VTITISSPSSLGLHGTIQKKHRFFLVTLVLARGFKSSKNLRRVFESMKTSLFITLSIIKQILRRRS
jgi:hypothetical protein